MTSSGDNTNIYEGIEACRPGSDDLQLPEMAHVADAIASDEELELCYTSVQRSDAAVAEAFGDVECPDGLQARLLAALAEESVLPEAKPEPHQAHASQTSRRMMVGGTLAASLLVALGVGWVVWSQPSPATVDTWVATANALDVDEEWIEMDTAPAERPATNQLHRNVFVSKWQSVSHDFDRNAVAYLLNRGQSKASLFVFRPAVIDQNLPLAPPVVPSQQTSQSATGVWTSDGFVYVLIVDRPAQYEDFLRGGAIANFFAILRTLA